MRVCKEFHIDSSHHLPGMGKCSNVHGHTWTITIGVDGIFNPVTGMLFDFRKLAEIVKPILEKYDHKDLNIYIEFPSAENLVNLLGKVIIQDLPYTSALESVYVKVQEGSGGWAEDYFPLRGPNG